jgi:hypothetical protein
MDKKDISLVLVALGVVLGITYQIHKQEEPIEEEREIQMNSI